MPVSAAEKARRAAEKYDTRTSGATNDLERGIQENADKWKENAERSGDKYAEGVQEAVANHKFQRGVQATSPEKFGRSITPASKQKYAANTTRAKAEVARVAQRNIEVSERALSSVGPRGRPGSPVNEERMLANMRALREDRVAREGTGGG